MATEKQANLAREEHSDLLAGLGAHAISVDENEDQGKKGYVVTAFVKEKTHKIPESLEIKSGKKTISVPVVVKVAENFKLE
jgi:hypothetical protein